MSADVGETLHRAFPHGVVPDQLEYALQGRIRKKLRVVGWEVCFPPGDMWEGSIEAFAIKGLDKIHAGYGTNPWFWGVAWPAVLGAAAVDFWPAVGTPLERHAVASAAAQSHLEALLASHAVAGVDPLKALPPAVAAASKASHAALLAPPLPIHESNHVSSVGSELAAVASPSEAAPASGPSRSMSLTQGDATRPEPPACKMSSTPCRQAPQAEGMGEVRPPAANSSAQRLPPLRNEAVHPAWTDSGSHLQHMPPLPDEVSAAQGVPPPPWREQPELQDAMVPGSGPTLEEAALGTGVPRGEDKAVAASKATTMAAGANLLTAQGVVCGHCNGMLKHHDVAPQAYGGHVAMCDECYEPCGVDGLGLPPLPFWHCAQCNYDLCMSCSKIRPMGLAI